MSDPTDIRLPFLPYDVIQKHKLVMTGADTDVQWFFGQRKGWLNISVTNFHKVRPGSVAVIKVGAYDEVIVTILSVGKTRRDWATFQGPDGGRYRIEGYNILAIKVEGGGH